MKRETLKKEIDNIIISECGFSPEYFKSKSESCLVQEEFLKDPLTSYNIISSIEKRCGVLVNDEVLLYKPNITYAEFIDMFYSEIEREHKKIKLIEEDL